MPIKNRILPDNTVGFLSKTSVFNLTGTAIARHAVVALTGSNGSGATVVAYNPTIHGGSYKLAVALGGVGTGAGDRKGTVVDWVYADLDTSATQVLAPVYTVAGTPGAITLTATAGAAMVGVVVRVGTSATDTYGTVYLNPMMFSKAGAPAEIQDVGVGATFADASLIIGSGGTCQIADTTGVRTLGDPLIQGQTATFTAVTVGNTARLYYANGLDNGTGTYLDFAAAGSWVTLIAVPVGTAGALRWRVLANEDTSLASS